MSAFVLKRMMVSVLLAGLLSGLVLTAIQKMQVSNIILKAEVYEEATSAAHQADTAHMHEHAHGPADWQPDDGMERTFYTAVADVTMGIGFALLLAAALVLRGGALSWRTGLLWGAAGYLVFFAAPGLGLHPEIPGTLAAPLAERQQWWIMTAALSAGGLALLAFNRRLPLKLLGVVLLVLPHLIGAPLPAIEGSVAPPDLARQFIYATALANAAFWLTLGGSLAYFYQRSGRSAQ